MRQAALFFWLLGCGLYGLLAQTAGGPAPSASRAPVAVSAATKPISGGYDNIKLGMAYQACYDALVSNLSLDYRGTPDVSFSPGRDEKIIEARGLHFIQRGIFQFRQEKLFTIILELNPLTLDYYTLYTTFVERYGEAKFLSPEISTWEDGTVRLMLEKPLTLKYLDIAVIDALTKEAGIEESGHPGVQAGGRLLPIHQIVTIPKCC